VYWCCARLESNRENVAQHFLKLAGYETYIPKMREQRVRRHRRVEVVSPLFPAYAFIVIEHQWHAAMEYRCAGIDHERYGSGAGT